ncbi:hypothetical protein [Citricoccus muralis]|uniref:Helix-turn-helix protein n=1 Tax=Citricoccus muralis TaxID=169134 RepID=A0ABY8HBD7_9MICC|nr:hypothetical protein [Citricoccus muralis]WFP17995.1 hypothetical protein P8192_06580 [Citricoccus muralis]
MYPLDRDLAATGVPVAVTCRVLGFTKQGFYKWCAKPISDRDLEEALLINACYGIRVDDPEFGHRFIADELVAVGYGVSERRVWRWCSEQKLFSHTIKRARKHGKAPGPQVCDDLVERDFTATTIYELWLTDITEHPTPWVLAIVATLLTKGVCGGPSWRAACGGRLCGSFGPRVAISFSEIPASSTPL